MLYKLFEGFDTVFEGTVHMIAINELPYSFSEIAGPHPSLIDKNNHDQSWQFSPSLLGQNTGNAYHRLAD